MKFGQLIQYMVSIPKSIYFNFVLLPFKTAIRLPFLVSYDVKFLHLKRGCVLIDNPSTLSVTIGFNGTDAVPSLRSSINIVGGSMLFKGKCHIARGCSIDLTGGSLVFGNNFSANKNFFVSCTKEIVFGDDNLLGWNVHLFDATGHVMYHNGDMKESFKRIEVGDHVWLCAESHLLKGSVIPSGSVVAYGSIVTKKFDNENTLYGGFPAKELQSNIEWGNFKDLI